MTTPYTINATAQDIEDALLNVINADGTPTYPSTKMVTSQGVKTYVDDSVQNINVSQLNQNLLIKENGVEFNIDTTLGDTHLVTSAAIREYVKVKALPTISVYYIYSRGVVDSSGYSPSREFQDRTATRHPSNTEGVDGGGANPVNPLNTETITVPQTGTSYIHIQGAFQSIINNTYAYPGTSIYPYEQFFKLFINGTEEERWEYFIGGPVHYIREVAPGDVITHECFHGNSSGNQQWEGKLYFYNYNF